MGAQRGAAAGFSRQEGRSKDKTRLCLALVLEGPSIGLQAAAFSQLAKGKNRGLLGTLKTRAKHRRVLRIGRPQEDSSRNVTASGGRGSKGGAASQSRRPPHQISPNNAWRLTPLAKARSAQPPMSAATTDGASASARRQKSLASSLMVTTSSNPPTLSTLRATWSPAETYVTLAPPDSSAKPVQTQGPVALAS